ncbi:MAG: hypothetical protein M3R09_06460, partial [Actinomycetota bacterium]|nr:hypothetical protein [Actinomycetota bacterium]
PNVVHVHLLDALVAWAPLMGDHLFPTEPEAGADTDLRQVLEGMWWRLDARAADFRWVDGGPVERGPRRIGLAMQALRARPAPAPGLPEPESPGG